MSTNTLEARFTKIVRDMDAEIVALKSKNAEYESKFRILNFPLEQATDCGKCGAYKHTPWKSDDYGYICATCLSDVCEEEKDELRAMLLEMLASAVPTEKEHPGMFMAWEKVKAILSNKEK